MGIIVLNHRVPILFNYVIETVKYYYDYYTAPFNKFNFSMINFYLYFIIFKYYHYLYS